MTIASNNCDKLQAEDSAMLTPSDTFILYRRRYLILLVLSLALFANGEAWMTFGSVGRQSAEYYGVDDQNINWFGTVFLVAFAIEAIPCTYLPQIIGLRWTLISGCFLNFIGSMIRFFSFVIIVDGRYPNYILSMFGNVFFGFAQGFLLNIPSLVSAVWFGDKERSTSTSIAYMSNAFGVGIGFLDVYLLIGNKTVDQEIHSSFFGLSIGQGILNSLILMLAFIIVKEKPDTPPSKSQLDKCVKVKNFDCRTSYKSMLQDMKKLIKNLCSLSGLIVFAANYGSYVTVFIFLNEILDAFDTDQIKLTGYIGAIGVILGGVFTVVIGLIMNKTKNQQNSRIGIFINAVCASSLSIILMLIILNRFSSHIAFILFTIYLGFCPLYITVGCEILADTTFPIDPNISSNLALILGNVVGSVMTYSLGCIGNNGKYYSTLGITIFLYLANAVILILVPFEKKRSIAEGNP